MIFQFKNIQVLLSSRSSAIRISLFVLVFAWAIGLIYFGPKEIPPAEIVQVTIPEGFNVRQIGALLEKAGMFSAGEFAEAAKAEEGFLFPDTYEFFKHSSPEIVIRKMKENFEKKVGRDVSRDVIIMASLLEEEAQTEADWKLISGILAKRLEAQIPLQVDAEPGTYEYLGLPPAPISNPGLEAIEAALQPVPSPYWYYLSDLNGIIHYAKTFEEHKLNKTKYLR